MTLVSVTVLALLPVLYFEFSLHKRVLRFCVEVEVDVVVKDLDALFVVKHRLRGLVFATKALARLFYNLLQGRPVLLAEVNIALHLRLVYASVHTDDDLAKNTHKIVWLPSSSLLKCLSRLNLTLLLFRTGSIP